MKSKMFIFLFGMFAICYGQTTWLPLNSGTTRKLTALSFPSAQTGFVVGEKGTILKTLNSGLTWSSVFSDTTQDFVSVSFLNPTTGYAASERKVYKTVNAGLNWQTVYFDSVHIVNVVHFINDSTGFIGSDTAIYKTNNSGASWTFIQKTTNAITTIAFPSSSIGYFTGGSSVVDTLYKTVNTGFSFTSHSLALQSVKERLYFINDTTGYLAGWYGGCLSKTTNGGMTWAQLPTTQDTQAWDTWFTDPGQGFYIDNSGGTSKIYRSSDGGITWTADISKTPYTFFKFVFTPPGKAFVVGANGSIYSTQLANSIKETKTISGIKIYPNPGNGIINIESSSEMNLSLTDELGHQLRSVRLSSENAYRVILSELSQGVYFLSGKNETGLLHQKIIVLN